MSTAKRKADFSLIEFRSNPANSKEGVEHLGLVLEFTTPHYWVVGLAMRAALDPKILDKLDPLSRSLLENRSTVTESEIDDALRKASRPGDVLRLLAHSNPWSLHVTEPRTVEWDHAAVKGDQSINQILEQYIFQVFKKAMAIEPAKRIVEAKKAHSAVPAARLQFPPEMPPMWMLPPQQWVMPLVRSK
jgi:hypothetical protein